LDRVASTGHDNRNVGCGFLERKRCLIANGNNDCRIEPDKLSDDVRQSLDLAVKGTVLDGDILSLAVAKLSKARTKHLPVDRRGCGRAAKVSDTRRLFWLLSLCNNPAESDCHNDSKNPRQFSIFDFRFPIVGKRIQALHPKPFNHALLR